jgi:hypothetical protein
MIVRREFITVLGGALVVSGEVGLRATFLTPSRHWRPYVPARQQRAIVLGSKPRR